MTDILSVTGKVWLVGAGPSDPGLLTIKGKQVLEEAQVVVYDQLVGSGILAMIPQEAKKVDAGKHSGNHKMSQEEINTVLVEEALVGKRVVRLKGGDPFLFGRGGEELEGLIDYGIPFEIVPGITSALAVPAYAGIPVTHRDYTASVHIVTAHRKRGSREPIDYGALAALGDVTLVFLMGIGALLEISQGLIKAGVNPDRPAAVLVNGTCFNQRTVLSTIRDLPEKAKEAGVGTPGIILVGSVCKLAKRFSWAEERPLGQCRVLVTRPKEKASGLAKKLAQLGAEVVELPAIKVNESVEPAAFEAAAGMIERGQRFRWILFTSDSGVEYFLKQWFSSGRDIRKLGNIKIGAVGPATARALSACGLIPDFIPQQHYGRCLGEGVAKLMHETKAQGTALLCMQKDGDPECAQMLEQHGIAYEVLPVYEVSYCRQELVAWRPDDCVVFASASAVDGFVNSMEIQDYSQVRAVCIGKKTGSRAGWYGMKVSISADTTVDSLVRAVIDRQG